jgi:hypothetical protein
MAPLIRKLRKSRKVELTGPQEPMLQSYADLRTNENSSQASVAKKKFQKKIRCFTSKNFHFRIASLLNWASTLLRQFKSLKKKLFIKILIRFKVA